MRPEQISDESAEAFDQGNGANLAMSGWLPP